MSNINEKWAKFVTLDNEAKQREKEYKKELETNAIFSTIYSSLLKSHLPELEIKNVHINGQSIIEEMSKTPPLFFEGVDLNVRLLEHNRLYDVKYETADERHQKLISESTIGDIFSIPVITSDVFTNKIEYYRDNFTNYEDILFFDILFSPYQDPDIAKQSLYHELGHAFIERVPFTCSNRVFNEYISICFELFSAYFNSENPLSFKKISIKRINKRKENHQLFSFHFSKELNYTVSYVLAMMTLEKYLEFTNLEKEEMLKEFKKVLNNQLTVEEFLKKYNIGFRDDKGIKLVKRNIERINS